MADQTALMRQWLLLKTLGSHRLGLGLKEMADRANVNQKTIRRDLELFERLGFPVTKTKGARGRISWRMEPGWTEPHTCFTFDEAIALYMGRELLEPLAGTAFWLAAQNAFHKIGASLSPLATKYLEKMADSFHFTNVGKADYYQQCEMIDELWRSIEERRVAFIVYQSLRSTEAVTYEVDCYGVSYHRGSLYLVAYSRDHQEVRHFKVNRIEQVEVTEFPYQMPKDFDLAKHFAPSFGVYHGEGETEITVRFHPPVVRYVQESKWHASQELALQPDGSLLATFTLSDTTEIKSWLLSFGKHAVVLEPAELRAEMREEVEEMRKEYEEGKCTPRIKRRKKNSQSPK